MPPITVRPICALADLERLIPAWESLAVGVPFREPTWLFTWWRHYGAPSDRRGNTELFTLAVEDGIRLIGLAPWYVERSQQGGRIVRALGSGDVCTDYSTILCEEGREAEAAAALAEFLYRDTRHRWDRIELEAAGLDDAMLTSFFAELGRREVTIDRRPGPNCWRVALPKNWESFLRMLSKSHRKQLRRLKARAIDAGRTHWHTTVYEAEFDRDWDILVDLHQRRRKSLGDPGCFTDPRFAGFHRDVARQLLVRGQLRLHVLELDGIPVAAEYHIAGRDVVFAYQSGIDPEALEHEPGRLAAIDVIRHALRDGFHAYDLMRGDESYKAHWRAKSSATQQVTIVAPRLLSRWRYRLVAALRTLRDAAVPTSRGEDSAVCENDADTKPQGSGDAESPCETPELVGAD